MGNSNSNNLLLGSSFDMVTLGNCFEANRIQPIPFIEGSLTKTLSTTSSYYLKPRMGYCAFYKESIFLVMDSDSSEKKNKIPLAGM